MICTETFDTAIDQAAWNAVEETLDRITAQDVHAVLAKDHIRPADLPALLAPVADAALEQMAQRARALTLQRFGRAIVLYVPLYVSSHCINACLYCGFRRDNAITRHKLSIEEVDQEMDFLKAEGFDHLLLVSGEHPGKLPIDFLETVTELAHRRFSSVSIEIYPLDTAGYSRLVSAGCDGLALYQETYSPAQYDRVHPSGPKRDFRARLKAVEAGAQSGMRSLGLGALLGLSSWRTDGVFLGKHASHLMKNYWRSRISFSFPRLRPAAGGFMPPHEVSDRDLVHVMCALRLAFPDAEVVVSTRESAELRDNLIALGIATRYSAGSRTEPGGYTVTHEAEGQFEIYDTRPPAEVARVIAGAGYEPVWKDWDRTFLDRT